jgi:fused signal recognition particle receptor
MAWIERLRNGLRPTRAGLVDAIGEVLVHDGAVKDADLEAIEEILIAGDIGVRTAVGLIAELAAQAPRGRLRGERILVSLKEAMRLRLADCERSLTLRSDDEPTVILVCGVNGSGKTTTIAKLAAHLRERDPSLPVTLAAADTFRAAAIEQLAAWAQRLNADLVKHRAGVDPSAVVFDAVDHVRCTGGVLFVDTAGRLQTKHNLMEELRKIERTVAKKLGRSSDERLLVLDATTGQNGISQATRFHEAIELTGIVLTKLDGTAKGGVVLAIWEALSVPLMYIGVGEQTEDLHGFSSEQFVEALFSG